MVLWPSMLFLLILLVFSCNNEVPCALAQKELLSLKKLQWTSQADGHRCFSQQSRTQNGATILEMKHKNSCSGPTMSPAQKLRKRLMDDDIRVKSIQSQIKNKLSSQSESPTSQQAQLPLNSGIKLQTLNYVVSITIGGRNSTVIVDTGSDLTWLQCQPCKLCYSQPEPLFNPSASPSYQSILCSSQACRSLQYNIGRSSGSCNASCNYAVTYGDGSYTRGELGRDRLILGSTVVDDFVFGCGKSNKGLFGSASGLMGLGRSTLSLISQTSDLFDGVFSYCLPDADSSQSSGSLVLGGDVSVFKNSTPLSLTTLLPNPQFSSFYVVNLTGASVGGVALQSPAFGKNGILIDSGTVITRLPPSIYAALKAEFLRQFTGYPTAPSFSILDTCFDLSSYDQVDIPTVRMQFEGEGELGVDVSGMFYFVRRDATQVCLAMASLAYEGEIGIIGNYQQRNTRVVYDTKMMRVGFAKEMCSFS